MFAVAAVLASFSRSYFKKQAEKRQEERREKLAKKRKPESINDD
jgi:hypothetical protein